MERIEIKPGYFIEVSSRLKLRAGLHPRTRLKRDRVSPGERQEIMENMARRNAKQRKFPGILVEEAAKIYREVGMAQAVKMTGVTAGIVLKAHRAYMRERGEKRDRPRDMDIMRDCVRLARLLELSGQYGVREAFEEGGRRVGIDGLKVLAEWKEGRVK